MKILCAWCGKDLGTKEPLEDTRTSHGICPECHRDLQMPPFGGAEIPKPKQVNKKCMEVKHEDR